MAGNIWYVPYKRQPDPLQVPFTREWVNLSLTTFNPAAHPSCSGPRLQRPPGRRRSPGQLVLPNPVGRIGNVAVGPSAEARTGVELRPCWSRSAGASRLGARGSRLLTG